MHIKVLVQKGYHPFVPIISISLSACLLRNRSVINFKMHFFNLSARCALPHVLSVSGLLCRDGIFLDEISGRLSNLYPHCDLYSRQCQFDNLQDILWWMAIIQKKKKSHNFGVFYTQKHPLRWDDKIYWITWEATSFLGGLIERYFLYQFSPANLSSTDCVLISFWSSLLS